MNTFFSVIWSSVGRKILTGITGIALVLFTIVHLMGNLLLFSNDPRSFNKYSHSLVSLGWILIILELGLLAFFIIHIISAISVILSKRKARPIAYYKTGWAGKPSRKSLASISMIYTGVVLLVFTVLHLKTFKFGPEYMIAVDGVEMRDLYRLVVEVFQKPEYVIWYVAAMVLLGFHLRHGFWSAFQSLGAYHPRYTPAIYALGYVFAVLLAAGYIGIPIWIYFTGGPR